jgi:hypothetical protein
LVIAAYIGLPAYATAAIVAGDWFMTATALVAWIIALRFGRPLLRWTFEGIEYGSI